MSLDFDKSQNLTPPNNLSSKIKAKSTNFIEPNVFQVLLKYSLVFNHKSG